MRLLILLTASFSIFAIGCSSDLGGDAANLKKQNANVLNVSPNPATVQASQSVTLIASGGNGIYQYNAVSGGSCTVNPTTGVVTAPAFVSTCYIAVTDTANKSAMVTVNVVAATAATTYTWQASGFGACSASCGGGSQSQTVTCVSSTGTAVADAFCTAAKPGTSQACNTQACAPAYTWQPSPYGRPNPATNPTYLGICGDVGGAAGAACTQPTAWCMAPYDPSYAVYICQ